MDISRRGHTDRPDGAGARLMFLAVASLAAALLALAGTAPAALAEKAAVSSFGGPGTEGGDFSGIIPGIAINQAGSGGAGAGDIYAVDQTGSRVQEFTPGGEFVRAFGLDVGGAGVDVCTSPAACTKATPSAAAGGISAFGGEGVAVDQETGAVYVADQGNNRVDVFSARGSFEGAFGWGVDASGPAEELQFCTMVTGCRQGLAGAGAGEFGHTMNAGVVAVAVSPLNGRILIADSQNRRVNEFEPAISGGIVTGVAFVRAYGWGAATGAGEFQICTATCHAPGSEGGAEGQFGREAPSDLTVDSTGRVYAADRVTNSRVQTFGPEGAVRGDFAASSLSAGTPNHVTFDPSTDHVVVMVQRPSEVGVPGGGSVYEFDTSGNLLEVYFPSHRFTPQAPLAVGPGGQVYAATDQRIYRLGTIVPPVAEIIDVETPSGTSATVAAKVNPKGLEGTYRVEVSSDGGTAWVPEASGEFPADEEDHEVTVAISGLEALTEYRVRVVGEKRFASGSGEDKASFVTPAAPPELSEVSYVGNTDTCVQLLGAVNPENQATLYRYEYVSEAGFLLSGFAGVASAPPGGGAVEAGPAGVSVPQRVCGLTPATTYHFRLSAENATGRSTSEEATFTTYSTAGAGLPDERAYEQVSPVDKNGADVGVVTNTGQAATSGDAVTFYTNVGLPGGTGAQTYPVFMARRSSSGWATQGLLPPASVGPRAEVLGWTPDLTHSYSVGWAPGAPMVSYDRNTVTQGVSPFAADSEPILQKPALAAATAEGKDVLFEDQTPLTAGAVSGHSNVYLWDAEVGRLVLAGALNNRRAPSEGAFAGSYDWFASGDTSQGGSAAGYYTEESHALSATGDRVFFTASGTGRLYMRLNPLRPQSAVNSEGRCTELDASKACTIPVSAEQRAIFVGASTGGGQALFMSSSSLTADANTGPTNAGRDLYLYDAGAEKLRDLTPEEGGNGAEVKGVLGYGEDASGISYVYFLANGALAEGATRGTCESHSSGETGLAGECNLYVWHRGETKFIRRLDPGGSQTLAASEGRDWAPTTLPGAGEKEQRTARVSPGGTILVFRSYLKLTNYDNAGVPELYRYDAQTGHIDCISCNPTGAPVGGPASVSNLPTPFARPGFTAALTTRNLSTNGNRVFFDTPDKLVSSDTNGVNDVYEWEAKDEGSCTSEAQDGGCLYLISTGTSPRPSYFIDASETGSDVFILTSQPLVAQDKDELVDVYDARVRGGIASQNEVEPSVCDEAERPCVGVPAGEPGSQQAGSPNFVGPGNQKTSGCKKGFRRLSKKHTHSCAKVKTRARKRHRHHGHGERRDVGKGKKHRHDRNQRRGGTVK